MKSPFFLLIFLIFLVPNSYCQLKTIKVFYNKSDFCSSTLILDSLGNFFRESGCEGRSDISLGKYTFRNGLVEMKSLDYDSISAYKKILKKHLGLNDSIAIIQFSTAYNTPVSNNHFIVKATDSLNKLFELYKLNNEGQAFINIKKYNKIHLIYLEKIFDKTITVNLSNSNAEIILNFPGMFFSYPRPRFQKPSVYSVRIKKDGLYDITSKEKIYSLK